jgi:hypothetical protein
MGIGGAIGGYQQVRVIQIGGVYRNQFYLYRPLRKPALRNAAMPGNGRRVPLDRFSVTAGTTSRRRRFPRLFIHIHPDRILIVFPRFPLLKGNRPRGTDRQTIAKAVTIVFPQQPCLAVNNADSAFVTGFGAEAAAVTFFRVNSDYVSKHFPKSPPRLSPLPL